MKKETKTQLLKVMDLWDKMIDAKDEFGNTLVRNEIVDEIDVLSRMMEREKKEEKVGRKRLVLPEAQVLVELLKKQKLKSLAKDLQVSRATVRNRLREKIIEEAKFGKMI